MAVGWLYLSQTVNVLILNLSFLSAKQQYVTLCLATYRYTHIHLSVCMKANLFTISLKLEWIQKYIKGKKKNNIMLYPIIHLSFKVIESVFPTDVL